MRAKTASGFLLSILALSLCGQPGYTAEGGGSSQWQELPPQASLVDGSMPSDRGVVLQKSGNKPGTILTIEALPPQPADRRLFSYLKNLLLDEGRALSDQEITALEGLIPPGNPRPSTLRAAAGTGEKRSGGLSKRLGDKDVAIVWTLSKTVSSCQPAGDGSRRGLANLLDYWFFKPLTDDLVQIVHSTVTSPSPSLSEIFAELPAIEAVFSRPDTVRESELTFSSPEGKVFAQARMKPDNSAVELQISVQRRVGTKPIPFFYTTVQGAANPRLVTSRAWSLKGKQVLVLLVENGNCQQALTVAFDGKAAQLIQTLTGVSMVPSEDVGQKGIIIKEAIGETGISRPIFYIFSNTTGKLVELTSVRAALARQELEHLKFESLLSKDKRPETQIAVACLMLDGEGELAERGLRLLQEMRDSSALKANKKLYQSLKKTLEKADRELKGR